MLTSQEKIVREVTCTQQAAPDEVISGSMASRLSSSRRSIPISISSPDLGSLNSIKGPDELELGSGVRNGPSRSQSVARMHSVKDAARDSAMEAALRNFEAKTSCEPPGRVPSAPEAWSYSVGLQAQVSIRAMHQVHADYMQRT